jgi:glycosyltransferase involved in cell wall biosynthesis
MGVPKDNRMSLQKDLVSIAIPAYNQPDYLRRTLQSAVGQRYRPIEVIVSDDCSPRPLEGVTREFAPAENDRFHLRFHRQASNLGVMDNFRFTVGQARGKYLVPFAHDNWFTDPDFIADAVRVMDAQAGCHLCLANSVFENSDRRMLEIPSTLSPQDDWHVLPGDEFIRLYRRGGLDWTQAIVLDHEKALALGAYDEPFMVNAPLARRLNSGEDNVCSYVFVLSAVGSVAVSPRCVCEIGTPAESYSRSDQWIRTKKKVKFVVFYNLYRASLKGPNAAAVNRMAYKQALDYVDHICDFRILRYYRFHPGVLLLAMLSLVRRPWIESRYFFKRVLGRNPITGKPFKKMKS